ncbi:MAG: hypothetical protein JNK47_24355 [Mesorhizobium sp.]|nr:hypothetical protein [Mesorhizobium sp.]MBL8580342.1 hypothetical protein [Mesorhizobium sp.]
MKASETIIAWNGLDNYRNEGRPGSIAVGPLLHDGDGDWTRPYLYTGGAAEVYRRNISTKDQQFSVLRDFYSLAYVYGLHPYLVHRAFLHIDEYQDITKAMGAGPDENELGHDPNVGYGRSSYPVPSVEERRLERSFHFFAAT